MWNKVIILFIILILLGYAEAVIVPDPYGSQLSPSVVSPRISGTNTLSSGITPVMSAPVLNQINQVVQGAVQTGSISITSKPTGARIWIDGNEIAGLTPKTVTQVAPGNHVIMMQRTGYNWYSTSCKVISGQTTAVKAILVPGGVPGYINVTSTPSGSRIWLDGTDTGKNTPVILKSVNPGIHAITLKLTGYVDNSTSVLVTDNNLSTVNVILVPLRSGSITVTSKPSGAKVWIDNVLTGKTTPQTFTGITPGNHFVLLQLAGYNYYPSVIKVQAGVTTTINAILVPGGVPGYINVTSTPPGASIWLDGKDTLNITPTILRQIWPGSHTVSLKKTGYTPYTTTVIVKDNELSTVSGVLIKNS